LKVPRVLCPESYVLCPVQRHHPPGQLAGRTHTRMAQPLTLIAWVARLIHISYHQIGPGHRLNHPERERKGKRECLDRVNEWVEQY